MGKDSKDIRSQGGLKRRICQKRGITVKDMFTVNEDQRAILDAAPEGSQLHVRAAPDHRQDATGMNMTASYRAPCFACDSKRTADR